MGAQINRLIAMGGTGIASPVQRYNAAKKDFSNEQTNRLARMSTQQGMDINNQKMQMLQQEEAYKGMAALGDRLDTIKDPAQRMQALQASIPNFQQSGIPAVPQGMPIEQIDAKIKQAQLRVNGVPDTPVKRTMPAGSNDRGQNMVVDRLYQGNRIVEESKPYVKKEIDRTADVDASNYEGKTARDKAKNDSLFNEESIYKTVHGLNKLEELYKSPEYVGGIAGDVIKGGNSIAQQFKQVTGLGDTGYVIPKKDIDANSAEYSKWRKAAMNGDRRSTLVIEIAYNIAKSRDKRVTDKDFQFAAKMVDASADRDISLQLIKDLKEREVDFYNAGSKMRSKRGVDKYRPYSDENYYDYYNITPTPVNDVTQQPSVNQTNKSPVMQDGEPDFDAIGKGIAEGL